jgi:uncharacterized protein YcaQ
VVHGAFLEERQGAQHVAPELATTLRQMQEWLELDRVEVAEHVDLAATLRAQVRES